MLGIGRIESKATGFAPVKDAAKQIALIGGPQPGIDLGGGSQV